MEAFIGALNGRVSVQDQVAASISQRTQATAYRQEGYGRLPISSPPITAGVLRQESPLRSPGSFPI